MANMSGAEYGFVAVSDETVIVPSVGRVCTACWTRSSSAPVLSGFGSREHHGGGRVVWLGSRLVQVHL